MIQLIHVVIILVMTIGRVFFYYNTKCFSLGGHAQLPLTVILGPENPETFACW